MLFASETRHALLRLPLPSGVQTVGPGGAGF